MEGISSEPSKQFVYCSFCRLSHKKGRKHVYSKRHQEVMEKILNKFGTKIGEAKSSLYHPIVEGVGCERGAKVWCYFCADDVDKHARTNTHTVKYGEIIRHLTSTEHGEQTDTFLHKNLLDKTKAPKFIISEDDMKKFRENANKAVQEYKDRNEKHIKQESKKIKQAEQTRSLVYNVTDIRRREPDEAKQILEQNRTGYQGYGIPPRGPVSRKKVIRARGEDVTSILQTNKGTATDEEGNIFSGAIPPWLRADPDTQHNERSDIGPTMEDFQKHLEREKKRKLPANRVGAQFDHTASTSSQWLPSFGRVWSKGRRIQSKNFFEKQHGFGKFSKKSSNNPWRDFKGSKYTSHSKPANRQINTVNHSEEYTHHNVHGSETSLPVTVKPYQKKLPATSMVTSVASWETSQCVEQNSNSGYISHSQTHKNNASTSVPLSSVGQIAPYLKKRTIHTPTAGML